MKSKLIGLGFLLSMFATSATAELIVINDRYMVSKDSVRGYFYQDRNKLTVFDIRWSDWSTQYRCQDTYDRERVAAASGNFVIQMKDAQFMDFGDFLQNEGFKDCKKF